MFTLSSTVAVYSTVQSLYIVHWLFSVHIAVQQEVPQFLLSRLTRSTICSAPSVQMTVLVLSEQSVRASVGALRAVSESKWLSVGVTGGRGRGGPTVTWHILFRNKLLQSQWKGSQDWLSSISESSLRVNLADKKFPWRWRVWLWCWWCVLYHSARARSPSTSAQTRQRLCTASRPPGCTTSRRGSSTSTPWTSSTRWVT